MTTKLDDLQVYQMSMEIAEMIWKIVEKWNYMAKETMGKQLIRASDSVAANLSEGYGRFSYNENKLFCYYSRGSLFETKTWLTKAHNRKLISDDDLKSLEEMINTTAIKLNNYIKSIGKQKKPMTK